MTQKVILLVLFVILLSSVLVARDYKEYGIGERVSKYPEIELDSESDGARIYTSIGDIAYYCGIYSKNLYIYTDSRGIITGKTITVKGTNQQDAGQIYNIWNERLTDYFKQKDVILIDKVPFDSLDNLETVLQDFFTDGKIFEIVYYGDATKTIATLEKNDTGKGAAYDVSVIMTLK